MSNGADMPERKYQARLSETSVITMQEYAALSWHATADDGTGCKRQTLWGLMSGTTRRMDCQRVLAPQVTLTETIQAP